MLLLVVGDDQPGATPLLTWDLAFRYRGTVTYTEAGLVNSLPVSVPVSVITGIRTSSRLFDYSKNAATLLVQFNETGAAAFFHDSLHELFGTSVSLDTLIARRTVADVEEQLAEAKDNAQRISIVERFLLSELKEPRSDPLMLEAVRNIKSAHGAVRIKDLLTSLPLSRDPFEKRFRQATGTSPKQFATIVRVRRLIETYPHDRQSRNLTDAALAAGYFDQAHFIKDFKSFTGQRPTDFFGSSSFW
jgi:AraC-like DNA-binding protein